MKTVYKTFLYINILLAFSIAILITVFFLRMRMDVTKMHTQCFQDSTIRDACQTEFMGNEIVDIFLKRAQFQYKESVANMLEHSDTLNNMRQILQAIHEYELDRGEPLPDSIQDEAGNALFSWRVLLLPYLGEQEFYEYLHLDEPWYSPHNRGVLTILPYAYSAYDPKAWKRFPESELKSFQSVGSSNDSESPTKEDLKASLMSSQRTWGPKPFPCVFRNDISGNNGSSSISAIKLPDGRKDRILVESYWSSRADRQYLPEELWAVKPDPNDTPDIVEAKEAERFRRNYKGWYLDPDHDITFDEILDGSFLKKMKELHNDNRFMLCCERGEYVVSADIEPQELVDFILEKCCKN